MTFRPRAMPAAGKPASGGKPSLFDRLRALFGLGGASIRDDIEEALADTSTEDDVSPQERALLKNVLALHEVHVGDVMVPRADIVAVSLANQARRCARGLSRRRSFAPAGAWRHARRSARHGAYPRFCRLSRRRLETAGPAATRKRSSARCQSGEAAAQLAASRMADWMRLCRRPIFCARSSSFPHRCRLSIFS